MKTNNDIKKKDEIIRQMISSTKINAPENLKLRVMHQIQTEKALTPQLQTAKKEKTAGRSLRDFRGIVGTAYFLLFGFSLLFAFFGKSGSFESSQYIFISVLVFVVALSFWGLTRLDAYVQMKRRK